MRETVQQRVQAVLDEHTAALTTAEQAVIALEEKRQSLAQQMEALQAQLVQTDAELAQRQAEQEALRNQTPRAQIQALIVDALQESQEAIYGHLRAARQVQSQLHDLRTAVPDLEQMLADSQEFERAAKDVNELPESYRAPLLAHHQAVKLKLQPYYELLERARQLTDQQVRLVVGVLVNREELELGWVFPWPAEPSAFPEEIADQLDELRLFAWKMILDIDEHPDWTLAELFDETAAWHGFARLDAVMEYAGDEPLAAHAGRLLQELLDARPADRQSERLRGWPALIDVAAVEVTAGEQSEATSTVPEAEPEAQPEPEAPARPLIELSDGWYKDEDVAAWERPLRVSAESEWTVQARRLRTVLINLVARGYMGGNAVAHHVLWRPLPAPHQEAVQGGIDRLVEHGVLLRQAMERDDEALLSVNPERIDAVQDLINRQIDASWQPILN